MEKFSLVFVVSKVCGGGAEHVVFQLANKFSEKGYCVDLIVTNQSINEANLNGLSEKVNYCFIGEPKKGPSFRYYFYSLLCKACKIVWKSVPDHLNEKFFACSYKGQIDAIEKYFKGREHCFVMGFLHPADQILMFCNIGNNKKIVSERADPIRYFKTRFAPMFLRNYYSKLDGMVFQTPNARDCYPETIRKKSIVIPNPVPDNIPNPYRGERKKTIVNFCRLTPQKNIKLLIDAFDSFSTNHLDYKLEIYGDGELKEELIGYSKTKKSLDKIFILNHQDSIHSIIVDYAMFVSTSDYEGISNSMLEAMAIGLPVICTDCPIGGAAFVIKDHENGLLVPVNDRNKLVEAMNEIADNPQLSIFLSENAVKIRDAFSMDSIYSQWEKYLIGIQNTVG